MRVVMASFWTPRRDRKLRAMWGKRRASDIAAELGSTPNAVIGRIHRILGTYKEKIARQEAASRETTRKRRKLQETRQRDIVGTMLAQLKAGSPRDKAVAQAKAEGATLQSIATAIGLSREGARQIVKRSRASK
jgi:hypothetical protein